MSSKRIRLSAQPNLHFASLLWPLLSLYAIQLSTYSALHAVYYVPKKEDVQLVWHHSALALKRRERVLESIVRIYMSRKQGVFNHYFSTAVHIAGVLN